MPPIEVRREDRDRRVANNFRKLAPCTSRATYSYRTTTNFHFVSYLLDDRLFRSAYTSEHRDTYEQLCICIAFRHFYPLYAALQFPENLNAHFPAPRLNSTPRHYDNEAKLRKALETGNLSAH